MERILQSFKNHPYLWALGIFVLGVILVFILVAPSDAAEDTSNGYVVDNSSQIAAGTRLQMAQLQAQTQIAGMTQAANVRLSEVGYGYETAKLRAQNENLAIQLQASNLSLGNQLSATVQTTAINKEAETQQLVSTLSAQVAQSQLNTQQSIAMLNSQTQLGLAQSSKDMQVALAQIAAQNTLNVATAQSTQLQTLAARDVQLASLSNQNMLNTITAISTYNMSRDNAELLRLQSVLNMGGKVA